MEKLKTLHMNAGNDETSYANNSGVQKEVITNSLPVLDATLRDMFVSNIIIFPKCFRIVDLGCSSGPNTLYVISHIMETIEELCAEVNGMEMPPEFQVFLNDLPGNDFNNLFKLLSLHTCLQPDGLKKKKRWEWFVAGLPGSFHDRLFPSNSLHFAFSSSSLHWLSQVPEGVEDNKENICIAMTSPKQVLEAYAKQFQKDLSRFLSCRAEEIVAGRRVVFASLGRSCSDFSKEDVCGHYRILGETLSDMVNEGLVRGDDLCSFNIPYYAPCAEEVDAIIRGEGSFNLDKMESFEVAWDAHRDRSGKVVADCIRAATEPLLSKHFGCGLIMDDLFGLYAKKVATHLSNHRPSSYFIITVSLSRNSS